MWRLAAFGFLVAALSIGCGGPTLSIMHEDPRVDLVEVHVDDQLLGEITFGEVLIVYLEPGYHTVQTYPAGTLENPWSDDGESWVVFVAEEAHLTLMQEPLDL